MSLRACYILSPTTQCTVVFSRIFSTVEKQTKNVEEEHYVPVPNLDELGEAVSKALGISHLKGVPQNCNRKEQKPVFEVSLASGTLWPLLIVEQYGCLFCCLPHVEQGSHTRPPLVNIPGVSMGFHFLLSIAEYLGQIPKNVTQDWSKFAELYLFISQAAPFGTPVDINPTTVRASLSTRSGGVQTSHKVPAWKPLQYKGKSQLYFTIREYIKAVQYDKAEVENQWEVYGMVICRADLEGAIPDITLTLCHSAEGSCAPLDHIIFHPFVQSMEDQGDFSKGSGSKRERCSIRVTPPLDQFTLCHYSANQIPSLPIQGFYQMKGQDKVEALLQLKLNPGVKNNFEYCEAHIPFFHRGSIKHFDANVSHGHVNIGQDKTTLVWNIGQKFPSKVLEVQLKATLKFSQYDTSLADSAEQQFCVDQNSYVQLHFKISDFTLSGLQLDQKALQVTPLTKYRLTSVREFSSSEYKIWNSHGDAPYLFQPPSQCLQEIQLANQQR